VGKIGNVSKLKETLQQIIVCPSQLKLATEVFCFDSIVNAWIPNCQFCCFICKIIRTP